MDLKIDDLLEKVRSASSTYIRKFDSAFLSKKITNIFWISSMSSSTYRKCLDYWTRYLPNENPDSPESVMNILHGLISFLYYVYSFFWHSRQTGCLFMIEMIMFLCLFFFLFFSAISVSPTFVCFSTFFYLCQPSVPIYPSPRVSLILLLLLGGYPVCDLCTWNIFFLIPLEICLRTTLLPRWTTHEQVAQCQLSRPCRHS